MTKTDVYLGLGGNIGDTQGVFVDVLRRLAALQGVSHLRLSRLYRTQPQDVPPQRDYLNAVCHLKTLLSATQLTCALRTIELALGKRPKPKEIPRVIDIDILFFGLEYHDTAELHIPHMRWRLRPFVLAPLNDLVSELSVPIQVGVVEWVDVGQVLAGLSDMPHREVQPIDCRRELTFFQQQGGNHATRPSQRFLYR